MIGVWGLYVLSGRPGVVYRVCVVQAGIVVGVGAGVGACKLLCI